MATILTNLMSMESHDKDYELGIKDLGWRILKIADGPTQVMFFPQRYIEPVIPIAAVGKPAVAFNELRWSPREYKLSCSALVLTMSQRTCSVTSHDTCEAPS